MANELSMSVSVTYNKNGITDQRTMQKTADVSGSAMCGGVQTIGTTEEEIAIGDIGTKGFARFLNIDATNYIEIGSYVAGTFYPLVKMEPTDPAWFRLAGVTLYARANTAAAKLEYMIYED